MIKATHKRTEIDRGKGRDTDHRDFRNNMTVAKKRSNTVNNVAASIRDRNCRINRHFDAVNGQSERNASHFCENLDHVENKTQNRRMRDQKVANPQPRQAD